MGQKEVKTLEDGMRGPIIRFDPEDGIKVNKVGDAIDMHIIPPLVIAHSELCEMITGDPMNKGEREQAWGYLAIMHNAIIMLARIGEETQEYYHQQRHSTLGTTGGGCGKDS